MSGGDNGREPWQNGFVMRQLLLLRHAKSAWDDAMMPDRDRPLNARGRRSAAVMRQAMRDLGLVPDVVLVSTSRRTQETLELLEPWDEAPLIEAMDSLYLANPIQLMAALHGVAETVRSVLLIGHNPGLHDFAVSLAGPLAMASGSEADPRPGGRLPHRRLGGICCRQILVGVARGWRPAGAVPDAPDAGGRWLILMELELTAPVEAAAGLGRLKALAANREGRARSQTVKIVWHDSPEHALLADGLALSEQRGLWRLERAVPGRTRGCPRSRRRWSPKRLIWQRFRLHWRRSPRSRAGGRPAFIGSARMWLR